MGKRVVKKKNAGTNLHFLVEEEALVHGGERSGRALVIGELNEGIRVVTGFPDDFASLHLANLGKEGTQEVLGHRGVEITHVEGSRTAFLAHARCFFTRQRLLTILEYPSTSRNIKSLPRTPLVAIARI